jgi:hypothetical protein
MLARLPPGLLLLLAILMLMLASPRWRWGVVSHHQLRNMRALGPRALQPGDSLAQSLIKVTDTRAMVAKANQAVVQLRLRVNCRILRLVAIFR